MVNLQLKAVDEKYHVSEKTRSALVAAEEALTKIDMYSQVFSHLVVNSTLLNMRVEHPMLGLRWSLSLPVLIKLMRNTVI